MVDIQIPGKVAKAIRQRVHGILPEGLSMQEVANQIGVTQATMSLFENEKRSLKPKVMRKLYEVLLDGLDRAVEVEKRRREIEMAEWELIVKQIPAGAIALSSRIDSLATVGQHQP